MDIDLRQHAINWMNSRVVWGEIFRRCNHARLEPELQIFKQVYFIQIEQNTLDWLEEMKRLQDEFDVWSREKLGISAAMI